MANGNLITLDYEFQLHDTLYGQGQNGVSLEGGKSPIEGLGVPDAKTQDVVFTRQDGSYANPDYLSVRQLTINCMIRATTEASAMTSLKALSLAWVPQTADLDLAFQLPGWGKFMPSSICNLNAKPSSASCCGSTVRTRRSRTCNEGHPR
jgi:hypothetical protein